jgi:transposase
MAMGRRRKRARQEGLWTPTAALPVSASHPFYQRLNQILDEKKFDEYVEDLCQRFYAGDVGRPGLTPGIYFRLLMVGYFEGIDSERGIAWRASDSLSIRSFVRIALDESVPDHSTISRTRRLMDVETHQAVSQWVLAVLAEKKLLKGTTIGVDATTLEANAALRSIMRRDAGDAGIGRMLLGHLPDDLLRHGLALYLVASIHRAEYAAVGQTGRQGPGVDATYSTVEVVSRELVQSWVNLTPKESAPRLSNVKISASEWDFAGSP